MARVNMEAGSGIASLSGRVGNLVFRMGADGTTYVQQAPTGKKRPGSAAQQEHRRKFGAATVYGRQQQGSAYYQPFVQAGNFGSVYRMALADFTKPPQLLAVEVGNYRGQVGQNLRVQARKPCGVVAVWVHILDVDGQALEEGAAAPEDAEWWVYKTQQTHPAAATRQLQALARDRPGNEAELVVDLK